MELQVTKGEEIFRLLSNTNELDWKSHLLADGNHNSAFGCSIELGQHQPGAVHGVAEMFRLTDSILPRCRIEDEQNFVGSVRNLLTEHTMYFRQFAHEILMSLEPTCRIHNAYFCP